MPPTDRKETGPATPGLINAYGEPYPELKEVVQACAKEMYGIAIRET